MQSQFKTTTLNECNEEYKKKYHYWIIRLDNALSVVEHFISVVCFVLMSIVVIIGIVMRFILKIPNPYGEELSRYLMVCGVFFGVSIGVRQKKHIGVTLLSDVLHGKVSKIVSAIADIITISAYIVFSWYALQFVLEMYSFGQTSPAMNVPMYIVYSTIMVGLLLSSIRSIMLFWNDYIAANKILSKKGGEL